MFNTMYSYTALQRRVSECCMKMKKQYCYATK